MKKYIIGAVIIVIILGGGYFASLHVSKEKPQTESDVAIKEILDAKKDSAEAGDSAQDLTIIAKGAFNPDAEESDALHRGSGAVGIVEFDGEQKVIFEEDFKVTNGPDYMIYLVRGDVPETKAAFNAAKETYDNIGRMKQFSGYQTFDIAAGTNTEDVTGVVVWCEQFGQFISSAQFNK